MSKPWEIFCPQESQQEVQQIFSSNYLTPNQYIGGRREIQASNCFAFRSNTKTVVVLLQGLTITWTSPIHRDVSIQKIGKWQPSTVFFLSRVVSSKKPHRYSTFHSLFNVLFSDARIVAVSHETNDLSVNLFASSKKCFLKLEILGIKVASFPSQTQWSV